MVGAGNTFVSMFIAANGVGKSAAGANIVTNIVFGIQNKYFDLPVFRNWPYAKRGRIISDPTTIKEKIIPELEKWFPVNESSKLPYANFEMGKEGKNYVCKITTNTGWVIDIMSTEQDDKEFESADLAFVWIDEPMPRSKFMATLARGRLGMLVFWTMTPLFQAAWIKDWVDEAIKEGTAAYVEAGVEDNCQIHGVRGILLHENIERMIKAMDENEKEARAFGKFGHLIGRIHKKFSRAIHVIKPITYNPHFWCTYKALDPHPRVPDHVLYMSIHKNGQKVFSSELVLKLDGEVEELYNRMKAHEAAMNYRMENPRIIDPSAFNDDQHREEKSVGSKLYDLGETWAKGSKDLMAGIKRTNQALNYEMKAGKLTTIPEIFVVDTLTVTIKQMEEYVWQEWKGSGKDDKKLSGKPRDKDDHMPENMHRLLLAELNFVPYQFSQNRQQGVDFEQEYRELDPYA